jgi:beta-glucosidase-like glycosyl hydrolase
VQGFGQSKKYKIFDRSRWADSVFEQMTLDEKIGQLFMVSGYTTRDKWNQPQLERLVRDYHVGGVIFFKGGPMRQALVTNRLQSLSKLPLLVAIDGEWGLSMRLDSTINYGYGMSVSATGDDSFSYKLGRQIAKECRRMGIHINFAPVVDVNNNPLNPVIHMRSFGENKQDVLDKGLMYMRGMQDQRVLAVAKHFPGHGNTSVDSHYDLPVLSQTKEELDTLELYPFKGLFKEGVGAVMTAHLNIPAYDTTQNIAASLSPVVSTRLLRWQMKFKGLAFSDALNMQGVAKYYKPGDLEIKALQAGNDILLCPEDVPAAFRAIKAAIDSGCLSMEYIDHKVRRILQTKDWTGLDRCTYIDTTNLLKDLNSPEGHVLKEKITERAVTVVRNNKGLIPLHRLDSLKIASVAFGTRAVMPFQEAMQRYAKLSLFAVSMHGGEDVFGRLRDTLQSYDLVIISLHNLSNKSTGTYGLTDRTIEFVNNL